MRSTLFAALLLAAIGVGVPTTAAAQDPEPVPIPAPPPPSPPPPSPAPPPPPPPAPAPSPQDSSPRLPEARGPGSDDGGSRNPRFTSGDQGGAVRRPSSGGSSGSGESSGTSGSDGSGAQRRGAVRRPSSDGSSTGEGAVPRDRSRATSPPRGGGGGGFYYNPYYNPYYSPYYGGYYDPWGYGAFGLGYFYYSPWSWSGYGAYGSPAAYPQYRGAYGFDIGAVRLKVKPRDAEVWVDGYYAGVVDDFDGLFQTLKLDLGAYRIEIRKPGFATLQFDVRVQPDRTITYRSEMKPVP